MPSSWSYSSTLCDGREPQLTVGACCDVPLGDHGDNMLSHMSVMDTSNVRAIVLYGVSYPIPEDGHVKLDTKLKKHTSFGMVFKDAYLDAQPRDRWSKGYHMPPCGCCSENVDMPSSEWPEDDDASFEKVHDYMRYTATLPLVFGHFQSGTS